MQGRQQPLGVFFLRLFALFGLFLWWDLSFSDLKKKLCISGAILLQVAGKECMGPFFES